MTVVVGEGVNRGLLLMMKSRQVKKPNYFPLIQRISFYNHSNQDIYHFRTDAGFSFGFLFKYEKKLIIILSFNSQERVLSFSYVLRHVKKIYTSTEQ